MANLALSYYPGCTLHHGTAREYDVSTRLVFKALGIDLQELPDWTCCGASAAHLSSHLLGVALPARNLEIARQAGRPLAISCALCFNRHRFASHALADASMREKIAEALGRPAPGRTPSAPTVGTDGGTTPGGVEVKHTLEVLSNVELPVKKPLAGLKVACYYGCYLLRPREIMELDDEENPQIMERLMAKVGATPLDWGLKVECCGAGMVLARPDMTHRLTNRLVDQARDQGADCLVTACPMCHGNLDMHQAHGAFPVLYFTQLLGLAMGLSPQELQLDKHWVDPRPLLKERGLA